MIYVKVEADLGMTHAGWAAECLELAKRLGVGIEIEPNKVRTHVFPDDTVPEILSRYFQVVELMKK